MVMVVMMMMMVVVVVPVVRSSSSSSSSTRHVTGADVSSVNRQDAGRVLSDTLRSYMSDLSVDNGLNAVGYTTDDIPALVKATLPQVCVLLYH